MLQLQSGTAKQILKTKNESTITSWVGVGSKYIGRSAMPGGCRWSRHGSGRWCPESKRRAILSILTTPYTPCTTLIILVHPLFCDILGVRYVAGIATRYHNYNTDISSQRVSRVRYLACSEQSFARIRGNFGVKCLPGSWRERQGSSALL